MLRQKSTLKPNSQTKQKIFNFLEEFVDSNYFQDKVKELRKKFHIPPNGFPMSKKMHEDISGFKWADLFFKVPPELSALNPQRNVLKELTLAIREISKKFSFYDMNLGLFFKLYVIYNEKKFIIIRNGVDDLDLINVTDFLEFLWEYGVGYPKYNPIDKLRQSYEYTPIIIRLHPSVTQRDLVGYIRDNWDYIQYNLDRYKNKDSKFGKVKKKNSFVKERNEFIFKNRNLPRRKIMELLTDKYGADRTVDYAYIGKIISLEKKKRKEV